MITYILVLFFHVGPMADNNSNAAISIPGFTSEQECKAGGEKSKSLIYGTVKEVNFVCLKQTGIPK